MSGTRTIPYLQYLSGSESFSTCSTFTWCLSIMSHNSTLMFIVLCWLCGGIRPLNVNMLSERGTLRDLLKSTDITVTPPQETTVESSSTSEDPVNAQNISTDSPLELSGTSFQVQSGVSGLNKIHLSLSLDSVDDMYYGCSQKMLIKVKRHFLPRHTRDDLHSAFTKQCALRAMKNKDIYDPLSWSHFRALCAYTAGSYDALNRAVRTGKSTYKTSFEFHALHFLLSDALRLLKLNQRSCYTSYRRSKRLFSGEPGQTIRFGSFASSSLNKDLSQFGRRSCFEIHTCFGAYLKSYSELDSEEDEVLIPPYEMFNIVSVDTSGQNDLQCEVLYKLETAGVYSSLNCQALDLY